MYNGIFCARQCCSPEGLPASVEEMRQAMTPRQIPCCRSLFLAVLLLAASSALAVEPLGDLTGPWQLFVDDHAVEQRSDLARVYHPFQKYAGNPVIVGDRPWEGPIIYVYGTVLPNEAHTGYRIWYHALPPDGGYRLLYATSSDGVTWTKPNLNIVSFNGSTNNNIFIQRNNREHIPSIIHTPWETDPQRHYKLMNYNGPLGGFLGAFSADGVHYTDEPGNPLITGTGDVGNFAWDFHTSRYLGYVKLNAYVAGLRRRCVAFTATGNWTSWPAAQIILKPDEVDDRWASGTNKTDFYGLCAFPYESMYIGFLWVLRVTGYVSTCQDGPIFVELVTSRDGIHWDRQEGDRPPILPNGPAAWDAGMVFTTQQPLVENGQIKLYYGGISGSHCGSNWIGGVGLATMRKDGFASLDAGSTAGSLVTRKLLSATGSLRVNYSAGGGGSVRVEVQDDGGNVVPGYALADCTPLQGDSTEATVTWGAWSSLPETGGPLRLRFVLQNASIYSFRADNPVTVLQPPAITQQPRLQRTPPGENAQFEVVATGIAPLSYRWQKNETDLSDDGHFSGTASAILTINSVASEDAGAYRCRISDSGGTTLSAAARLQIGTYVFSEIALPGSSATTVSGMSSDGTVVCGTSDGRAFIWTAEAGLKDLGLPVDATASAAAGVGVSADRTIIAAVNATTPAGVKAMRWDGAVDGSGTFSVLPRMDVSQEWTARALGTDGNEVWIAGSSINGGEGDGREAGFYRQSTNQTISTPLPSNGHDHSDFLAVSDDGMLAGQYQYSIAAPTAGPRNPFIYTRKGAAVAMNTLVGGPSTSYEAVAKAISRNGLVQGGWSQHLQGSIKPVLWTDPVTLATLPFATGGDNDNCGEVLVLSGDGSIAAGSSYYKGTTTGPVEAFIWDAAHGTRFVASVLAAQGFDLTGWTLQSVTGMSADGASLCGEGVHHGVPKGWVVAFADMSPRPPLVTQGPQSQVVHPGESAVFTVEAIGSLPIAYQWQYNGSDILDGGRYAGTAASTLVVSDARGVVEGSYRCRLSNALGEAWSTSATLSILTIRPDLDHDGDVDQADFGLLQTCLTGPLFPQLDPECESARLTNDSSVDRNDVILFLQCLSGDGVPFDPSCLD